MEKLKIDNSKKSAKTSGKWENPGSKFYDELLTYENWRELLKEAYLVAPVDKIDQNELSHTSYTKAECKYPHHVIEDGKLVLSVPGVKAAYTRACQWKDYRGEIKAHLAAHLKELNLYQEAVTESVHTYFLEGTISDSEYEMLLSFLE